VLTPQFYIVSIIAAIIISATATYYFASAPGEQYRIEGLAPINSQFEIHHTDGTTSDTLRSLWHFTQDDIVQIKIIPSDTYPDKEEIIKDAILSEDVIEIDNSIFQDVPRGTTSLFYLGWKGALDAAASYETNFIIPVNFEFIPEGGAHITIALSDSQSEYSSGTILQIDEFENRILKSNILILNIDEISDEQLQTLVRHEFGRALGLGYSLDPNDLMYPTLETQYPYISECDIDAIVSKHNGENDSSFEC